MPVVDREAGHVRDSISAQELLVGNCAGVRASSTFQPKLEREF